MGVAYCKMCTDIVWLSCLYIDYKLRNCMCFKTKTKTRLNYIIKTKTKNI